MAASPRPKRLPPEIRRRELLDAARAVIGESGFEGLSVESIAQRAGVTRPVVYDLFGDLDGLVVALFDREEQVALTPLLEIIGEGDPTTGDPEAFLVDAVHGFLRSVRAEPATWRLILVPPQGVSADVRERFVRTRRTVSARVAELLDWGIAARGGPGGLDHELFARLIVAAGEDAARLTILHPRRYPPDRLASITRAGLAMLPAAGAARGDAPPVALDDVLPPPAGPPAPSPTGRMPRAARREQLLDVTLQLVGEEGWDALSVEAIARRAGVNRAIVYRSFATLPLLLVALLRREDQRTRGLLDGLLPADAGHAPAPVLLFETLARFLTGVLRTPETYRVVLQRPESAPVVLRKLVAKRRTEMAARLQPLVEVGLSGIDAPTAAIDVDVLSRLLLSAAEELARLALDDPAYPVERILAGVWGLLDLVPVR